MLSRSITVSAAAVLLLACAACTSHPYSDVYSFKKNNFKAPPKVTVLPTAPVDITPPPPPVDSGIPGQPATVPGLPPIPGAGAIPGADPAPAPLPTTPPTP